MQFRFKKYEKILYATIVLVAFALRLMQLGRLPLSDIEAEWALQAFNLAEGSRPLIGPNPFYVLTTSLLFFIFGDSTFLSRLLPALTGSLLVLVPPLFRQRINPIPALLLAFFLALDPGLIALSRQTGSLMPALTFVFSAWGFWRLGRPRVAGILAGLALLSGPSIWMGIFGLGLAWILSHSISKAPKTEQENNIDDKRPPTSKQSGQNRKFEQKSHLKPTLIFLGATILLGGTMFMLSPNGLSAWLSALPAYLSGWVQPSGIPVGRLLFALLIYHPGAVLFGILAVIRGGWKRKSEYMRVSLWVLSAIILIMIYPGRQVGDLAWVVVPLWLLTAFELTNHFDLLPEETREVVGISSLVLILLVFFWMNYTGIALDPRNPVNTTSNVIKFGSTVLFQNIPSMRYLLLIGTLLILLLSVITVALGWSARVARLGLVYGLTLVLGIYSFGMAVGATGLRTQHGWELWWPGKQPFQAELLVSTLDEQSEWSTGDALSQDITVISIESPSLDWILRNRNVQKDSRLNPQEAPAIVISQVQDELNLPIEYRGQDFTWRQEPLWDLVGPYEWIKWSVFREIPFDSEIIIMWVRNDLFVDTNESAP